MKALAIILAALLLALQYPLWFGKGGWLRVRELNLQNEAQKTKNATLTARNGALDAEVRDLKEGLEAVEERARVELGLIKPGEIFVQVVPPASSTGLAISTGKEAAAPVKAAK
jgi:cell division protein FtsB